jgi:phenylacetate-CoA ligase
LIKLRSALAGGGIKWPAVPSPDASELLALLYQLNLSERWPAATLLEAQRSQIAELISHACTHVAFYADRIGNNGPILATEDWLRLPVLTREDVLLHAGALRASKLPRSHGRRFMSRTSGSTGQPVEVVRTELLQRFWEVITLREHIWHRRDASGSLGIIRANVPNSSGPRGRHEMTWGSPFDKVWETGCAYILNLATDVREQAQWLQERQPTYLLTYPANLAALLDEFAKSGAPPVREVISVGGTVSPQLRARCVEVLGAPIVSNYSSQELGYLALQCPDCAQYHVQSESVFVEIIDESGAPCSAGKSGRVIVTDLHNFAMPLIRYEIGDYAEVGEPCSAGRGLPSLRQVLGRRRNMVVFPDGKRHWPMTGFARFNDVARIRQYQFIQHTRECLEVRLVVDDPLSSEQLTELRHIICNAMGYDFRIEFSLFTDLLPANNGGKFEEFICKVQ